MGNAIGLIFYLKKNLVEILTEKFKKRGIDTESIQINRVFSEISDKISGGVRFKTRNSEVERIDGALVLDIAPLGELSYAFESRLNFLTSLESRGVILVNPTEVIRNCMDKERTSLIMAKHSIPTPYTFVVEDTKEAVKAAKDLEEIVVKPLYGSEGRGMVKVKTSSRKLTAVFNNMLRRYGILYVQEFVPNPGRDIRVICLGGKVAIAVYRIAKHGEWRSNVYQGGRVERCELTAEVKRLVLRTARAFGDEFLAIDVLESQNGPVVIEVNCFPRWLYLMDSVGYDLGEDLVDYMSKKVRC